MIDSLGIRLGHENIQIKIYIYIYANMYVFFQMLCVSHIIFIIFLTQVLQVPIFHTIISHRVYYF